MDCLREALLEYAKKQMIAMATGSEFTVEDLFKDFKWRDLPISVRRIIGNTFHDTYFSARDAKECELILKTDKNNDEQRVYVKK